MAGVYISYPFCAQKCTYCNFASGVFPGSLEIRYVEALRSEIERHAWKWRPETIYLGGGTPSSMHAETLRRLLSSIPGRPWPEFTLETAPGTVTAEKAQAWCYAGINRVSLGVQSFVKQELARTGRRHRAETVRSDLALLRDSGIQNCNIDLIAGLPGQTQASWQESLDWVERLAPQHVSIYMLEVDEESRLGKEVLSGGVRYGALDIPPDELTAELYEIAVERLHQAGIRRYEISNFARPGKESRHNLKYWKFEPYAGFGADAHSFDGVSRRQNVESPLEYVARFEKGAVPCVEATPANPREEKFFVGLRLDEGIRPDAKEWKQFDAVIRRFVSAGLLESDGEVLRLTRRGVMLSNEVFQEFLAT